MGITNSGEEHTRFRNCDTYKLRNLLIVLTPLLSLD